MLLSQNTLSIKFYLKKGIPKKGSLKGIPKKGSQKNVLGSPEARRLPARLPARLLSRKESQRKSKKVKERKKEGKEGKEGRAGPRRRRLWSIEGSGVTKEVE